MMHIKTIIRIITATTFLMFSACGNFQRIPTNKDVIRWPDFLREWAADYEIIDPQRMAIIDQIDTLYRLVEDSTENTNLLCEKICQTQDVISDAIMHDSSLEFSLMMRATARNFYGIIYNHPWVLELECDCEVLDFLLIDSKWYTEVRENFDIMYTTILGLSWEAPARFANLILAKEDDNEHSTTILNVYDYVDTIIGNLQISFTNSEGNIIDQLTEKDIYVYVPDAGIKSMMLPPYLVMYALASGGTMAITYDTPNGRVEMIGYPHIHFLEQIEACPRLKVVLTKSQAE